jgi:hypothetical protein
MSNFFRYATTQRPFGRFDPLEDKYQISQILLDTGNFLRRVFDGLPEKVELDTNLTQLKCNRDDGESWIKSAASMRRWTGHDYHLLQLKILPLCLLILSKPQRRGRLRYSLRGHIEVKVRGKVCKLPLSESLRRHMVLQLPCLCRSS